PEGTPITTSHIPALRVLRKNPRRWAHQVYSTRSPRSWANRSAILFSKPSSRWFENGRLFGSAQTRRTPAGRGICCAAAVVVLISFRSLQPTKRITPAKAQRRKACRAPSSFLCVFASLREKCLLRKREHIQHASSRRVIRQVTHRAH